MSVVWTSDNLQIGNVRGLGRLRRLRLISLFRRPRPKSFQGAAAFPNPTNPFVIFDCLTMVGVVLEVLLGPDNLALSYLTSVVFTLIYNITILPHQPGNTNDTLGQILFEADRSRMSM